MTDYHAPLPPSSAYLWGPGGCPGAMQMQRRQPPEEETEESREGTAAHWLLSQTIRKIPVPADAIAPNGVPINDEMREAIVEIVQDFNTTVATCKPGDFFFNEKYGSAAKSIHPNNGGTADIGFVSFSTKTLYIWDFKFGHRFIDIVDHLQTINYCAIAIEEHNITNIHEWSFVTKIAQPRCYIRDKLGGTLRQWSYSGNVMKRWITQLSEAAYAAENPNAPLKTGDHCKFCTAAWACPANQRAGGHSVDLIFGQQETALDEHAIALEAKVLAHAKQRASDRLDVLNTKILALIDSGQNVPYHEIQFGNARLVWKKEKIKDIVGLLGMFGIEAQPGIALPTPRQCMIQGIDESVIKPYVQLNSGKKELVRIERNDADKALGRR